MRPLTWLLIAVALVLVVVAVVYFVTPANQLPSLFPGDDAHLTKHHTKHGIAVLGLAVLALVGAWFSSAPARSTD
jgi:cytochrome b561